MGDVKLRPNLFSNEIMKRVNAIAEARETYLSEELMNEFLSSKGIEVERSRRRRRV